MFKAQLLIVILIFGITAFADESTTLLTAVQPIGSTAATANEFGQLDHFFQARGFAIVQSGDGNDVLRALNWPHRIYASNDLKKRVFLKLGALVKDVAPGKSIEFENGVILNYKTAIPTILYFKGFQTDALERLQKELGELPELKENRKTSVNVLPALLIPTAFAGESCVTAEGKTLPQVGESGPNEQLLNTLKQGLGCAEGTALGLWDATGGASLDYLKILWGGAQDVYCVGTVVIGGTEFCADRGAKTLHAVSGAYDGFVKLVTDFNNVMSSIYAGFQSLPPKERGQILCELMSSLGTAAVITYVTAGAGAPVFLEKLAQAVEKLNVIKSKALQDLADAVQTKLIAHADFLRQVKSSPQEVQTAFAGLEEARKKWESAAQKLKAIDEEYNTKFPPTLVAHIARQPGTAAYEDSKKLWTELTQALEEEKIAATALAAAQKSFNAAVDKNVSIQKKRKELKEFAAVSAAMSTCREIVNIKALANPPTRQGIQ